MKRFLKLAVGALALLSATPAFGDTLIMHCAKSDCVRARCDDWRENCSTIAYYRRSSGRYFAPRAYRVCDEFGDCRFALPSFPRADSAR